MHPTSGNDLKTFLLHGTAFLCVPRFLQLASIGTVNALMIAISVTFQPLFSVIPKIFSKFACEIVESLCKCYLSHCSTNIASLTVAKLAVWNREYARHVRGLMAHKAVSP